MYVKTIATELWLALIMISWVAASQNEGTTITAIAVGDPMPAPMLVSEGELLRNGDFLITRVEDGVQIGDGSGERTNWTLDFRSDPDFAAFSTIPELVSAQLTLRFVPVSNRDDAHLIWIEGLPEDNPLPGTDELSLEAETTIQLDLLTFYSSGEILAALAEEPVGQLPMAYQHSAIVSFVQLRLVSMADHIAPHITRVTVDRDASTLTIDGEFPMGSDEDPLVVTLEGNALRQMSTTDPDRQIVAELEPIPDHGMETVASILDSIWTGCVIGFILPLPTFFRKGADHVRTRAIHAGPH